MAIKIMSPTHYLFNHFPKAGGTSFFSVLKQKFAESAISPQLIEDEIRLVRPERFEHYQLIRGHFSIPTQMRFARSRYSMTLLRDPIRTIVSGYNYRRHRSESDLVTELARKMSFAEYVRYFRYSPAIIDNPYVHHFAGCSRDYPGRTSDPSLLLAYAKHNLTAFNFVGICEQLEDSIRLLCHDQGWQTPSITPHENRSRPVQSLEDIDPETMEILRQCNQLDLHLYGYAQELFRKRYARSRGVPVSDDSASPADRCENRPADSGSGTNRFLCFPLPINSPREATIRNVRARWAAGEPSDRLEIAVAYESRSQLPELIAGIMILNSEGEIVYGTNTWMENIELHSQPDSDNAVIFELTCALLPGVYSVSAALHTKQVGFHYDWLDRATVFEAAPVDHAAVPASQVRLRSIRQATEPEGAAYRWIGSHKVLRTLSSFLFRN